MGVRRKKSSGAMGPLPARADCTCRICRPGELEDDLERGCVETVLEHGWQVMLIGAGDQDDEPAFAYTVGLGHRRDYPELVVSGLSGELMHRVLNEVAARAQTIDKRQPRRWRTASVRTGDAP